MDTPQEERQGDPSKEVYISTLRYYPVGSLNCASCGKPGESVRLASNPTGDILVTVMCNACAKAEAERLVEHGDMVKQGPILINVNFIAAVNERARAASETADTPDEKVPTELEAAAVEGGSNDG